MHRPSWRRTFFYAWQSLRLRFGRSVVTAVSVVGAIAFLVYTALALDVRQFADTTRVLPEQQTIQSVNDTPVDDDFFTGLRRFSASHNETHKRVLVVVLSLMVCFVGITNSMLMSIKERFREIATLKCLGAVNAYVRRLFLIEAVLQGGTGSLLGMALGTGLFFVFRREPVAMTWVAIVETAALAIGLTMSLLAALWPLRRALAMAPVEALRVEE